MTATGLLCGSCGVALRENAKFCDECGTRTQPAAAAEYKQVTVLFADVVRSMDIAAAVGAERLREIMAELVKRSTAVVQRYGGTVDKFTGDGIMALFGAPVALEDHAFRACLAALNIQQEAQRLAHEVEQSDGISLSLRVGLNSGQVIAGDIGSGSVGYTAIGEHVGLAQRMESVAPTDGVMLSESTARLVEHSAVLAEPEMVRIKGVDGEIRAHRLISTVLEREELERNAPTLVGRTWEMNSIAEILDEAISGLGCVVNIIGPPGIGKSRLAHEAAALAANRGADVITTFCESHTSDIPFHAVGRLLQAAMGIKGLDSRSARARVRALVPDADSEDLLLLDDLLGIADTEAVGPVIEPDARRRRLTALINAAVLARATPAIFVVEDVHWIDEVSEAMIAAFAGVIPQSRSMALLTYRPEYQGALARVAGAQAIALRPLSNTHTSALVHELLGSHGSVAGLAQHIAERAAGNPFFAEELVRDLAERNVLDGKPGGYTLRGDGAEVSVPATLQATIAARIDRLATTAKQTLSAGAVIGLRFGPELLMELGIDPALDELVAAELIDQVKFTRGGQYAFRHPLVRTVAYESQLKSSRAQLHRRLAKLIEGRQESIDDNAALIAEHLEAAGDLHEAFGWHMRAGTWTTNRDIVGARMSWQRAREIADRLPADDADRVSMRIAPRTLLCLSAWRAGGAIEDAGFEELRSLTAAAGDKVSFATGMTGQVAMLVTHSRYREAAQLASENVDLLESIGDPELIVGLSFAAFGAKAAVGDVAELLRLTQRVIDLSEDNPTMGDLIIGSPLAAAICLRGIGRLFQGAGGWKDDVDRGMEMARETASSSHAILMLYKYSCMVVGAWVPNGDAMEETAVTLSAAERFADEQALGSVRFVRGITLVQQGGSERDAGFVLLEQTRLAARQNRVSAGIAVVADLYLAAEQTRCGNFDGAISLARSAVEEDFESGDVIFLAMGVTTFVDALLRRGNASDLAEAEAVTSRLAAVRTHPDFILNRLFLLRLRALLARAKGEEPTYREFAERYLEMAESLGFEGHIAMAKVM